LKNGTRFIRYEGVRKVALGATVMEKLTENICDYDEKVRRNGISLT